MILIGEGAWLAGINSAMGEDGLWDRGPRATHFVKVIPKFGCHGLIG